MIFLSVNQSNFVPSFHAGQRDWSGCRSGDGASLAGERREDEGTGAVVGAVGPHRTGTA